ncbi:MAG: TrkA C-terminal domain-containing protein [Luteococcus sp.]|uniref:TrkA C-terminal domain-containing protein n=1 Tax=Luteococcus sp. TaxID=1969402 RepID=UPI002648BF0C|nr:TrkA C-terminal domain-containing protein [Luteococcus sp.]MDN5562774.1 TrkA C-terminal domain-containing protein [Luteococcus sp.]
MPAGALHKPGQVRILAHHRDGRWSWHPRRAELLQPGDLVAVAATREGMAQTSRAVGE